MKNLSQILKSVAVSSLYFTCTLFCPAYDGNSVTLRIPEITGVAEITASNASLYKLADAKSAYLVGQTAAGESDNGTRFLWSTAQQPSLIMRL